jgi:hypothetical protein
MRALSTIAVLSLGLLFLSCVPSLNPYYTEDTTIFDPALVGTWGEPGKTDESWKFESVDNKGYKITLTSKEDGKIKQCILDGCLTRIGNSLYLDIYANGEEAKKIEIAECYGAFVPSHGLIRILQINPSLHMSLMNLDRLKEILEKNPTAIKFVRPEDDDSGIFFIDTTDNLRNFIKTYGDTNDLFDKQSDTDGLVKLSDTSTTSTASNDTPTTASATTPKK